MKVASLCLLAVLTVVAPIGTHAALLEYELTFGPNDSDPDGGIGFFHWDTSTQLISNLNWDFGGGNTGGVNDATAQWDLNVLGASRARFVFEILTLTDVHPTNCTGATACSSTFLIGSVNGFPGVPFTLGELNNGPFYSYEPTTRGSLGARLVGEVQQAPAPGSLALLAIGLAGLGWARRKK
jgi:hypothetical protein